MAQKRAVAHRAGNKTSLVSLFNCQNETLWHTECTGTPTHNCGALGQAANLRQRCDVVVLKQIPELLGNYLRFSFRLLASGSYFISHGETCYDGDAKKAKCQL